MDLSRVARGASLAAAACWAVKAAAIGVAGGLGRSALEGPSFLLGLGAVLVAVVCLAVSRVNSPGRWRRGLAGGSGVLAAVLVTAVVQGVVGMLPSDPTGWVWGELNLWVLALIVLVLSWGGAGDVGRAGAPEVVASDSR